MNVTTANFNEFFDEFKQYLPQARFLSFDFEMTGIATAKESGQDLWWDLPFERYGKMQAAANKYNIIQTGLSLFIPKKSEKIEDFLKDIYEVRSYNIYVFPRENSEFSPQISCDASAMAFNIKHGMDWQKWIVEGVSYINIKRSKKMLEKLNKEKDEYPQEENFMFSDAQKKAIDEILLKLEKWVHEETSEVFLIQENHPYKRSFYYNYLEKRYQHLTVDSEKILGVTTMKVMRFSEAQKKAYFEEKKKAKLDKLEADKGFTRVFELIAQSKVPIVGHNCYFDLLFWMRHFHNDLSSSYAKFKRNLHKYFPSIYDTKFIANNSTLMKEFEKGSSLSDYHKSILFGKLKNPNIQFIIPPGFEGYRLDILEEEGKIVEEGKVLEVSNPAEKVRYHEAGYDAFLTGISFLHLEKFLNLKATFEKTFLNKLNLLSSYFILNIAGNDEMKSNALVFVIQDNKTKKEYKNVSKEVEFAFKDLENSVWVKPSYSDQNHPIFISFKESSGNTQSEQLSEDLSTFFNIQNKAKQSFFKILCHLKNEGIGIMSFARYVEIKIKGSPVKKKPDEVFDI